MAFLKVGRLLVASRDIRPWEAVIEDNAVVVAPGDHPLCVLCLGDLGGEGRCLLQRLQTQPDVQDQDPRLLGARAATGRFVSPAMR